MTKAEERLRLLRAVPWVSELDRSTPCQGVKWSKVALRDLYSIGGKPPRGLEPEAHCKRRARWRFVALEHSHATSGDYCTSHLLAAGLYADNDETERAERWLDGQVGT